MWGGCGFLNGEFCTVFFGINWWWWSNLDRYMAVVEKNCIENSFKFLLVCFFGRLCLCNTQFLPKFWTKISIRALFLRFGSKKNAKNSIMSGETSNGPRPLCLGKNV